MLFSNPAGRRVGLTSDLPVSGPPARYFRTAKFAEPESPGTSIPELCPTLAFWQ